MPELRYVGGLVIRARDPRALARWYSEKFGLLMGVEHAGVIYGGFRSGDVAFHFGIAAMKGSRRFTADNGISITFNVDDFQGYLRELADRGVRPVGEAHDEEGHFAVFRDPENNEVTIWQE